MAWVQLQCPCGAKGFCEAECKCSTWLPPTLFLLANWHTYTSTVIYLFFFFFGLVVMCEISSSGEVSAEGLGIFVLLSLLVELLVVVKRSFFKMYSKKRLVRKLICHETALQQMLPWRGNQKSLLQRLSLLSNPSLSLHVLPAFFIF